MQKPPPLPPRYNFDDEALRDSLLGKLFLVKIAALILLIAAVVYLVV